MSQIFTLNMIIDLFRDIADRHLMVNDFGNGPSYNIGASRPMKFPYLWVENQTATTVSSVNGMKEKQYTFVLYLMDKINKGDDNFDEIISDTDFILDGIIQEFSQSPFYVQNRISLVNDIIMQPVVEATDDNVNGWQATLTFKVPIFKTYCDMPILPVTTAVQPECEFIPFKVVNGLGCEFLNITDYPGPTITLPTIDVNTNAVQAFRSITINNETISSINQIDECSIAVNLVSKFPILLTGSSNCLVDTILTDPSGIHQLPDVNVTDLFSNTIQIPAVTNLQINAATPIFSFGNINDCTYRIAFEACPNPFPITLRNSNSCVLATITSAPSGGSFLLPNTTINDDDGLFGSVGVGSTINIIGATISAITTTGTCNTNIILNQTICEDCFPINIVNSEGCLLQEIEDCDDVCPGYTWRLVVGFAASVSGIQLLDCNGKIYKIEEGPFTTGTYEFCHGSETVQPVVGSQVNFVTWTQIGEGCSFIALPDTEVYDDNGLIGSFPMPTEINISGASASVDFTSCSIDITIDCPEPPPAPENGAYPFNGSVNSISDVAIIGELLDSLPFIGEDSSIHKIATGFTHIVAIKNFVVGTGGELWVFGINTNGAIGGATEYVWERIGSDSDWTDIAAAGTSTYAIRAGRLYVTGQNNAGQLGDGTTTNIPAFTQIGTDTDWTFVSAGEVWAAAVKGGNLLTCGSNASFKTGLNTSSSNQTTWAVANNTQTWLNTSCGRSHGAAVTTDGKLFSWGLNSLGRTGQNTTSGSTPIPTQIGSDTNWILSSTCNANIYALKSTGTLWGAGAAAGSIWGNSSPSSLTQESLGDTNWDWITSTGAGGVYARKTTGTLWSSGVFPGNLISTTALFQLNQVGTDTNWKKEFVGNTNGFSAQITFIKS